MLESLCLVRLGLRKPQWRSLLDEHSKSLDIGFESSGNVDIDSFYEGHTMDLVTFATRVCKVLGVETMIGATYLQGVDLFANGRSHKRSWWSQPDLPRGRHCVPKRRGYVLQVAD